MVKETKTNELTLKSPMAMTQMLIFCMASKSKCSPLDAWFLAEVADDDDTDVEFSFIASKSKCSWLETLILAEFVMC